MTPSQDRARIEREIRHKAERRVRMKMALYWHAAVFALVNAALIAINLAYTPDTLWFVWPLGGWGAALVLHALAAFQSGGLTSHMIDAEVQRELQRRGLA